MHLPVQALPGSLPLLLDPAGQAIAAQVFGGRAAWWRPGEYLITGDIVLKTAGLGIKIAEGTNARMGTAVLVAGTVTVNTTAVAANSRIYLTSQTDGGTPGWLRVSGRTAGTSFDITSSSATDTSTVAWLIVEPA